MLEPQDIELIKIMLKEAVSTIKPAPKKKAVKKKSPKPVKKRVDKAPKSSIIEGEESNPLPIKTIRLKAKHAIKSNTDSTIDSKIPSKGSPGYIETFKAIKNRPNYFLTSDMYNMFKSDTQIDKKLSGKNHPTPRREKMQMYEVDCIVCGKSFVVTYGVIPFDTDTGDPRYVCNDCVGTAKG
jgi:hypothetical protein